jgi:iron complex outermembrane receptor protein
MRDDPRQSHNPDDETENDYLNAGMDFYSEPLEGLQLDANMGWSGKQTESDVASWFMFSDTELNSFSAQPKATLESDWAGMAQRTTVGVDAYLDQLDVDRYGEKERLTKTIDASLEKETLGVYARHQVELTPEWILNGGGRVEQARLSVEADAGGSRVLDESQTHHGTAWEAGLTYAFEKGCKVFTRVNSVYRYPFVDEQISYYGFGSDSFYRELDAEQGLNTEVGLELGYDPRWRTGVTLFRLDMRDEVAWDPIENRNANLDETRRQGAEWSGSWKPVARVELSASYTYTDAKFTSGANDGNKVPLVPAHVTEGTVKLGLPLDLAFDTTVRHVGSCPLGGDVANAGDKLDAYSTLDLTVRYQPGGKAYSGFVGVENVTDENYATVAYKGYTEDGYYPSPGRNWRVGMNLAF